MKSQNVVNRRVIVLSLIQPAPLNTQKSCTTRQDSTQGETVTLTAMLYGDT